MGLDNPTPEEAAKYRVLMESGFPARLGFSGDFAETELYFDRLGTPVGYADHKTWVKVDGDRTSVEIGFSQPSARNDRYRYEHRLTIPSAMIQLLSEIDFTVRVSEDPPFVRIPSNHHSIHYLMDGDNMKRLHQYLLSPSK
jgi:hypothetical protein